MFTYDPKVLLIRWMEGLDHEVHYQFLELFAGHGNVCKVWFGPQEPELGITHYPAHSLMYT